MKKKNAIIIISIIAILTILAIGTNTKMQTTAKATAKENKKNAEIIDINTVEDFYKTEVTKNVNIKNLPEIYSIFDAQKENCFIVGAMVHNENLYYDFMEDYKNKKTSFIRVAQKTTEGNVILLDILYYEKTNKLYLVTDNTRDSFASKEDRKLSIRPFDATSEYKYKTNLYWILYNGQVNEDNFSSENVFRVVTIN
ncbi:MAG: DUF4362 domain-containing protein, partial [Clostridia bacterium]